MQAAEDMMKCKLSAGALALCLLVGPWCAGAAVQANIFLDFDNDGDPWTLRTELPEGVTTATAAFVLEVVSGVPPQGEFYGQVAVECVGDPYWFHHYGVDLDPSTLVFDTRFLSALWIGLPTCMECCPYWPIGGQWAAGAPVAAGQRYFVGAAVWRANCDDVWRPPTQFTVTFTANCGGVSALSFQCPLVSVHPATWGEIKGLYRD
jgi:hypothetical protein